MVSHWRIWHEHDPWSFVCPLCAVSTVPAHRVGCGRRLWYAYTRRLDPSANRACLLSNRVFLDWPDRHGGPARERSEGLAAGSLRRAESLGSAHASVTFGDLNADALGISKSGIKRSLDWIGGGTYALDARLGAGEITLSEAP